MSALSQQLATVFYRQAARVSARMLAASPMVESLLLHRSVATGEDSFGRSDIDMVMVVKEEVAAHGASMARLYQLVRRARMVNPALGHIDVYDSSLLAHHARTDTFWASIERRALMPLRGKAVAIPIAAVHPDHALSRFLLWVEWFFSIAVQQRNGRNLRKTALESWNAYASAEGLIEEPYLSRNEMEAAARRSKGDLTTQRLEEPAEATRFVFELAQRLHRSRLPALRTLARPLVFEAITAPLCLRRRFVVLPRSDSPLPAETFVPGAFPCTPELLDLFLHTKNAFFYWILPPELEALGIRPPTVSAVLRSCRYYGDRRFLPYPGFADPSPPTQTTRMAIIRHAVEWASRGELPPAIPQEEIRGMMSGASAIADYYRTQYDGLLGESRRLEEALAALSGQAERS